MQLLLPKMSLAVIQLLIGCFDLAAASLLQPHQRSQTLHQPFILRRQPQRNLFQTGGQNWARIVNVYGAQESIPLAYVAMRACTSNGVVVPARQAGNRFLGSFKVHKYWLWILSKRFWSDQWAAAPLRGVTNQWVAWGGRFHSNQLKTTLYPPAIFGYSLSFSSENKDGRKSKSKKV